jgi:rare lipoprotein A
MKTISKVGVLLMILLCLTNISPAQSFKQSGIASFYADKFVGRTTANGEKYRHNKLTAAHKTLPFGTTVKVKNLENGKEVVVRINDRGPFVEGRIIDLSKSAAEKLDFVQKGIVKVEITTVGNADQSKEAYSTLDRPAEDDSNTPTEYYSISVDKVTMNGFGVQIGSFTEMVNLVELAHGIKRSFKQKAFVQVSVIQGVKHYKLIVGSLSTREKANKLKMKVAKDYPDSFVIKF